MLLPGCSYSVANTDYRYGFNGKEKDDKDGIVQYDYGFRIYDPRLVRFKSVDPISGDYPELTPYQFASNRPIDGIDRDGLEWGPPMKIDPKTGERVVDGQAALDQMHANNEMAIGFYESAKETVTGLAGAVRHPINTLKGVKNAIAHPINTFNAIKNKYIQEFKDNQARAGGKLGGDILQLFFGAELFKGSKIAKEASIGEDVGQSAKITSRINLASEWGIHSEYVEFGKAVYTKTQDVGEVLYQYRIPGSDAGSYYVKSLDVKPEMIGLSSADYTEAYKVTVNESTNSLISTHIKDATYWRDKSSKVEGGGQQIFSPDLKNNASFEQIPLNGK